MILLSATTRNGDPTDPEHPSQDLLVLFPRQYRTGEFMQLIIPLLHDRDSVGLLQQVVDAVEKDPCAIWKDDTVEVAFWNFADQLAQDLSNLTGSDRAAIRECVEYVKSRLATTSASGKRTRAVLDICFPHEARREILRLRGALAVNDVDGIFEFGPACQARWESFNDESKALQTWLRRQFVLLELGLRTWDYDGRIAEDLTTWVHTLDEAVEGYTAWLEQVDEQDSDSDQSMDSADTAVSDSEDAQSPLVKVNAVENVSASTLVEIGGVTCEDLTAAISLSESTKISGVFSTVRKGTLVQNGREELVAVKFLRTQLGVEAPVMFRRFRREVLVWTSVQQHGNILPIYGVYLDPRYELPALVSPWCTAGNLVEYIGARRNDKYPVISLCLDLLEQVLSAVKHLHEHNPPMIHGDLKSRNILVSEDAKLQLCDFGLSAVHTEHDTLSLMSSNPIGRGTIPFMSPELLYGDPATSESDMWAVSSVFVEMVSGVAPYHQKRGSMTGIVLAIVNGELPARPDGLASDELWSLITTNWNQIPEKRLSARAMLSRVLRLRARCLAGEPDAHRRSVRFEV